MSHLTKIKHISWQDVLDAWEASEAEQNRWRAYWEESGFNSWRDWRDASHKELRGAELGWALYKVDEPLKAVNYEIPR